MRRIVLISTFYNKRGGVSKFVKGVENELLKNPQIQTYVISPDIDPNNWPKARLFVTLKTFATLISINPSEIHCHCPWYLQLGALIYSFYRKKTQVFAFKHSDINIDARNSLSGKFQTAIDLKSTQVIFISKYLKDKWSTIVSERYYTAPHIKGGTQFPSTTTLQQKPDKATINRTLTYVGLFEYPGKVEGLELLIESFELYANRYEDTNTTLKIVGDGSLRKRVERKIAATNISSRIQIFDQVDDPKDFYLASDLHCHITYQDTTPLVIMEALALGIPVLASKECGIPEIEAHGLHLVENQASEIADQIRHLLVKPPSVELSYKHSWEAVTKEILNITNQNHYKCQL